MRRKGRKSCSRLLWMEQRVGQYRNDEKYEGEVRKKRCVKLTSFAVIDYSTSYRTYILMRARSPCAGIRCVREGLMRTYTRSVRVRVGPVREAYRISPSISFVHEKVDSQVTSNSSRSGLRARNTTGRHVVDAGRSSAAQG